MGTSDSKIDFLIQRAAAAYTAGPAIDDARTFCEQLANEGIASTVCYWDLNTDAPQHVSQAYVQLIDVISRLKSDSYLSVKAPSIRFDFDLLQGVLEHARNIGATVHFDSMGPQDADRTLDLIARAYETYPRLGLTIPARWRRSVRDVEFAIRLGLRVRVVKGEWPDSCEDVEPRQGYLKLIDRLSGNARHVAVATHNARIAEESLMRLRAAGTSCELELLYGLPARPMMKIARKLGVPARMYVPYGKAWLPYRLKNAGQNPRILGWFVHDLLRGNPGSHT